MFLRNTVTLHTSANVAPAAARHRLRFSWTCRAASRPTPRGEDEAAGAHDVGEVADRLGHPGDSNLFAPTDSVHGPPRLDVRPVSLGETRRDRAGRPRSAV